MKFLVVNMYSFRNKGCEAFTKVILNEMSKLDANAEFKVFTADPIYDSYFTTKQNVSLLHDPFADWYSFSRWWQYRLIGSLGISERVTNGMKIFRWADAVISTDDVFSSTYGWFFKCLAAIQMSKSFHKPTILLGQSIGPFEKENEYRVFVSAVRNVKLITARESITLRYVKDMNLRNTRIELTADPAFCLEPDTQNVEKLWKAYGIPDGKTIIGLAPSQAIAHFGKTSSADHFNTLKKLVEFLSKKCESHVLLIPHVDDTEIRNNDRVLCEQLYRQLDFPKYVTVVSLDHSAEEMRALVGKVDVLLAERMHAAIDGLSQCVPTFVIGYSVKFSGILSDILGSTDLDDYMLPIAGLSDEVLRTKVQNLVDKREYVARQLSKTLPRVKEDAKRNFALTMEVLNARSTL